MGFGALAATYEYEPTHGRQPVAVFNHRIPAVFTKKERICVFSELESLAY
jgi:hypothetical protein